MSERWRSRVCGETRMPSVFEKKYPHHALIR